MWKKGGKKVYEKPLQSKHTITYPLIFLVDIVTLWTIAYDMFLFKPSKEDENSNYIHIVDLKHDHQYYVEDFVNDLTCKIF